MADRERRSVWFYLFGCTPTTGVLLAVLAFLILLPVFLTRWSWSDEPRAFRLPNERTGRAYALLGDDWGWSKDVDSDGGQDCFSAGGPLGARLAAAGHESACSSSGAGWIARIRGIPPLDDEFRGALDRAARFKRERGWLPLSVTDVDGDGAVDCVVTRDPMGLVLGREGVRCPFEESSLAGPIGSSDRLAEFQALLGLDEAIRDHARDLER